MIKAGKYRAKAIGEAVFSESAKKATPQVEVECEILDGEHQGESIRWIGFFTEATGKRTADSLATMGCDFPDDDVTNTHGLGSTEFQIVVEHEEYDGEVRPRVKWVNSLLASVGAPMSADAKSKIRDSMKGALLLRKQGAGRQGADDGEQVPWG